MSPLGYWLCAVGVLGVYIAVRLVMIHDHLQEPTEFDASYDALREAERMIANAKYGPIRDGHEV